MRENFICLHNLSSLVAVLHPDIYFHIFPGMSDISSATPQPMISVDMQNTIRSLHYHTRDLRSEVNKLRRLQMTNMETMRESIHDTYKKLKVSCI